MNKLVENEFNSSYPLWCWVKCYNNIASSKRKGEKDAEKVKQFVYNAKNI